ncbi:hypothetical protein GW17_00030448 [Ensete ventricosum]|nr:hypothetical protein GW17_00030448 [Ensete ventricosum]
MVVPLVGDGSTTQPKSNRIWKIRVRAVYPPSAAGRCSGGSLPIESCCPPPGFYETLTLALIAISAATLVGGRALLPSGDNSCKRYARKRLPCERAASPWQLACRHHARKRLLAPPSCGLAVGAAPTAAP